MRLEIGCKANDCCRKRNCSWNERSVWRCSESASIRNSIWV